VVLPAKSAYPEGGHVGPIPDASLTKGCSNVSYTEVVDWCASCFVANKTGQSKGQAGLGVRKFLLQLRLINKANFSFDTAGDIGNVTPHVHPIITYRVICSGENQTTLGAALANVKVLVDSFKSGCCRYERFHPLKTRGAGAVCCKYRAVRSRCQSTNKVLTGISALPCKKSTRNGSVTSVTDDWHLLAPNHFGGLSQVHYQKRPVLIETGRVDPNKTPLVGNYIGNKETTTAAGRPLGTANVRVINPSQSACCCTGSVYL
jgi:hypothetical protein